MQIIIKKLNTVIETLLYRNKAHVLSYVFIICIYWSYHMYIFI